MMRFLSLLRAAFAGFTRKALAEQALPERPSAGELLARFLFSKNHYSSRDRRVKPHAFLPEAASRQTSVFRTLALSDAAIWDIGKVHVAIPSGRTLRARGDVRVDAVEQSGLRLEPDNAPPRHAAIAGWPIEKDHQMLLAMELANAARLVVVPNSGA